MIGEYLGKVSGVMHQENWNCAGDIRHLDFLIVSFEMYFVSATGSFLHGGWTIICVTTYKMQSNDNCLVIDMPKMEEMLAGAGCWYRL